MCLYLIAPTVRFDGVLCYWLCCRSALYEAGISISIPYHPVPSFGGEIGSRSTCYQVDVLQKFNVFKVYNAIIVEDKPGAFWSF
jgi:hypothetical protein